MEFVELSKEEFQKFSEAREDYNIWQSVDMAELREIAGFHSEFVGVKENNEIIAGGMLTYRVVMGYRQYYAPRGFLIDFHNQELLTFFLNSLKDYAKKKKSLSIRFDPYVAYKQRDLDGNLVENGFDNTDVFNTITSCGYKHHGFTRGIDLTRECRWMYVIPLEGYTEDTLLASFERNARRSVQRTIKYKIYTKELDESNVDEFIRVAVATGERRGFEVRSAEYYRDLLRIFGKRGHAMFLSAVINLDYYLETLHEDAAAEQAVIDDCNAKLAKNPESSKITKRKSVSEEVLASYQKRIEEAEKLKAERGTELALSSSVFFVNKNEIMCLLAGVYEEYKQFASPFALHWQMMKYGMEHGIKRYNLYGISGIFDESADDYGVYLFKKEFNGEVIELLGEFEATISPMNKIYHTLRNIKHGK